MRNHEMTGPLTRLIALGLIPLVAACDTPQETPTDAINDVALVTKADAPWSDCELNQVLLLVNDPETDEEILKAQGVHALAARNIIVHRDGPDGIVGTVDDDLFDDLTELDQVPYVGPQALEQLVVIIALACENITPIASDIEVIFSPQTYSESHLSRVVTLLGSAQRSLDIAMYSFRDPTVMNAVGDAVERGVSVRLLFDSANEHKSDPKGTRSAILEEMGVDVRYVNKIMHHKFVLIDGPRDHLDQASDTVLITGSANWSYSAGTRYDENTLVVYGNERLVTQFQGEFNLLWDNSRDLVWNESLSWFESLPIAQNDVPWDGDADAVFTSANFHTYVSATYGPTFTTISG
ncbi:MAG: phospholipase D-like domain-containing protein, partial [Myxococcota bacterium]|nr:phospholipase D-like domain-containing protein [Myxococcota bacterium]